MSELQVVNNENQIVVGGTILDDAPSTEMISFSKKMAELYPDILKRANELIASENRIPEVVDNDTDSGKIGDFIKQITACDKSLDACRKEEKEPHLAMSRRVDGFFNGFREPLKKLKDKASKTQAAYIKQKEDEERRKREEEAARLKAEAEAKAAEAQRIAEEAERKRKEAEEKERLAREEAERKQRELEEKRRQEREEAERKQREIEEKARKEKEAADAEIARIKAEAEEQAKIDAETKRKLKEAEAKAKEAEKQAKAETRELQKEMKEQEKAAKAETRELQNELKEAEAEIKNLNKEAIQADREATRTLDSAVRTEKQSNKMDILAKGKASDLARTRGFEGSVSTVRTTLKGMITSRKELDLEALRPFFKDEHLQYAVDQLVKAHGERTSVSGVAVIEEDTTIVR